MKHEKVQLSAYALWLMTNLLMQKNPHKLYSIDDIVKELKKFVDKGWENV